MATKVVTVTQPNPAGPYNEALTDTASTSAGTPDAGKVVLTGADGKLDPSLLPPSVNTHAELLTDGEGNLVFANGDLVYVLGVPN